MINKLRLKLEGIKKTAGIVDQKPTEEKKSTTEESNPAGPGEYGRLKGT